MSRIKKFAISIPEEDFERLEVLRKKERLARSQAVLRAIRLWEKSKEMERLIEKYEAGYKKNPEMMEERIAWEKASLTALVREKW